jgi:hypothetical protein
MKRKRAGLLCVERRGGEEGRERGSGELLCVRDRGEGRKKKGKERKGKKW